MRRDSGVTLVEVLVATAITLLVGVVIYNAFFVLFRSERSTDRESARALLESQLLELLFQDIRSSISLNEVSPNTYQIVRLVPSGGTLAERRVTWTMEPKALVTRRVEGEPIRRFSFVHLIDPKDPPFKLRLERVPEGRFEP